MHAMRAYGSVYVWFHPFLSLTLDSSRQLHISAGLPGRKQPPVPI